MSMPIIIFSTVTGFQYLLLLQIICELLNYKIHFSCLLPLISLLHLIPVCWLHTRSQQFQSYHCLLHFFRNSQYPL